MPIKRVSMASRSLTTFAGRSIWCRSSSGPCRPTHSADGITAAHVTLAADRPWNCHHSPFRVLRTSLMPSRPGSVSASPLGSTSTAMCCASSTSKSSPADDGRGSFCAACSSHGNSRRLAPAAGRARLTLQESVNFCSCASSTCAIASKSHRIASGTWTRQLCAWFQQARGWTKRTEPAHVFASRAFVTVTLAANMRGGMWTQIVFEKKTDRVHPHGPHFPRQLVSHSPTHWITQEALLDMIDVLLDCARQHVATEFRSIMRDTRPHIKLCYVQRNFTGNTQPLDRAYMRAFKNSIHQEVAKHFAEFFLEIESNFEHVNLDSITAVFRHLLLSFVHTAAQNADSPQHRTAGWRFIDWTEVARRLLETGELFPRGTAEEPHAPDEETQPSDSEPEAHVVESLADDHSSDGEDAPTGVEESAAPAAPAVAAAPKRAAMSLLERLQAIRIIYGSTPS